MTKKFYKVIAISLLSTISVASYANVGKINTGPYVGASVGLSNLSGRQDFNVSNNALGAITPSLNVGLASTSFGASIFGGYGVKLNSCWFAAELSYLFDRLNSQQKAKFDTFIQNKTLKTRSTGAWEGAFHLGYVPHDNWVIYAIAGIELRRFQVSFKDDANDIAATINKKYMSAAFVPGLGIRVNLTKNIAFRGEYKCALHRSKSLSSAPTDNPAGLGVDTVTMKQSPRIHAFRVGLVYSF